LKFNSQTKNKKQLGRAGTSYKVPLNNVQVRKTTANKNKTIL